MQIQINTDSNIEGRERLTREVEAVVLSALGRRFSDQITRLEIHFSDVNSHAPGGDDKRCLMEARLAGRQPVAVSHQAATAQQATAAAAEKLKRFLDRTLGRLSSQQRPPRAAERSSESSD
ncbi:MAG: hypothetical protein H0V62_03140 [Gammaproteobacteria bacterium]|nr:hypothetical protein [Gammaproteobacteria bacterium]